MEISGEKSKIMEMNTPKDDDKLDVTIGNVNLQNVEKFKYSGAIISADSTCEIEVKTRIAMATQSLSKLNRIWKDKDICLKSKIKIMRAIVMAIALYGCETLTLTKILEKRIEAFEMRCYRRLMKISYTEHRTNDSVRQQIFSIAGKLEPLLEIVRKIKLKWFGHVTRRPGSLAHTIIHGMVEGSRKRGRPKTSWIANIKEYSNKTIADCIKISQKKEEWKKTGVTSKGASTVATAKRMMMMMNYFKQMLFLLTHLGSWRSCIDVNFESCHRIVGMEAVVRVEGDIIARYRGDGDVVAWLKKVRLVAKLKKVEDLASFLPLYLEGDALALYLEMSEAEQVDADSIEQRLKEAFTDGPFVAYGKLCKVKWTGEQVDVYANGIRRLAGLAGFSGELIDEFQLELSISHVASEKNKADKLTRVRKAWLGAPEEKGGKVGVCCSNDVKLMHARHHMGVDRSLYLARRVDPNITRKDVREAVRRCERCQSIDPAPVVHQPGVLSVDQDWKRLAIDVTHYRQLPYLTMIDCGPGRVALWRELSAETADIIVPILDEIFFERGPVDELLMDNARVFHSRVMREMMDKWGIKGFFRTAYRATGNGIIERHHRTIKAMAERGRISPAEAVFWYNVSPRSGQDGGTVPQRAVFRYDWRCPGEVTGRDEESEETANVQIGEEVWVKPGSVRCTSKWGKGKVDGINSRNNVSIDGVPRHILDIRKIVASSSDEEMDEGEEVSGSERVLRQSQRRCRPPAWSVDYEM
ncbi:putative uncharacterized transposon-derived protein F52C9.6 [Nymphon striatum]|nr:putative uncharacterized transposon-derived protein F52C9.6 [Nymphon striatum]